MEVISGHGLHQQKGCLSALSLSQPNIPLSIKMTPLIRRTGSQDSLRAEIPAAKRQSILVKLVSQQKPVSYNATKHGQSLSHKLQLVFSFASVVVYYFTNSFLFSSLTLNKGLPHAAKC